MHVDAVAWHRRAHRGDRLVEQRSERHRLERRLDGPGVIEQVAHHVVQALRFLADDVEQELHVATRLDEPPQAADRVEDDAERIAHLVGDGGRQFPEGGEPLALDQLRLGAGQLRVAAAQVLEEPRGEDGKGDLLGARDHPLDLGVREHAWVPHVV